MIPVPAAAFLGHGQSPIAQGVPLHMPVRQKHVRPLVVPPGHAGALAIAKVRPVQSLAPIDVSPVVFRQLNPAGFCFPVARFLADGDHLRGRETSGGQPIPYGLDRVAGEIGDAAGVEGVAEVPGSAFVQYFYYLAKSGEFGIRIIPIFPDGPLH